MKMVDIHEAEMYLSQLLERVANDEEIIIAKSGAPVARLVAYIPGKRKGQLGKDRGLSEVHDRLSSADSD